MRKVNNTDDPLEIGKLKSKALSPIFLQTVNQHPQLSPSIIPPLTRLVGRTGKGVLPAFSGPGSDFSLAGFGKWGKAERGKSQDNGQPKP